MDKISILLLAVVALSLMTLVVLIFGGGMIGLAGNSMQHGTSAASYCTGGPCPSGGEEGFASKSDMH